LLALSNPIIFALVFFPLDESPTSEFYMPTFRNNVCSIFIGGVSKKNLPAYTALEDGTDSVPKVGM